MKRYLALVAACGLCADGCAPPVSTDVQQKPSATTLTKATGPTGRPLVRPLVIHGVSFAPDGRAFLASETDGLHFKLRVHSAETGRELLLLDGASAGAFSHDGRFIVTTGADGVLRLCDRRSARLLNTFDGKVRHCRHLAVAPDDSVVLAGDATGALRLWDTASGKLLHTLLPSQEQADIYSVAFSPDGKLGLSSTTARVR